MTQRASQMSDIAGCKRLSEVNIYWSVLLNELVYTKQNIWKLLLGPSMKVYKPTAIGAVQVSPLWRAKVRYFKCKRAGSALK